MSLKVVHKKKDTEARELWEKVLKPKWKARDRFKAEKDSKKLLKSVSILFIFFLLSCGTSRPIYMTTTKTVKCKTSKGVSKYKVPVSYRYSFTH